MMFLNKKFAVLAAVLPLLAVGNVFAANSAQNKAGELMVKKKIANSKLQQ